jgi:hypothetical protein
LNLCLAYLRSGCLALESLRSEVSLPAVRSSQIFVLHSIIRWDDSSILIAHYPTHGSAHNAFLHRYAYSNRHRCLDGIIYIYWSSLPEWARVFEKRDIADADEDANDDLANPYALANKLQEMMALVSIVSN